ncbi:hypothetical protein [Microvirga sp. CF3016]|uniref:hypothetical protein n=1 Tax=Microvirga sp. CF3016 TaxID=3110181 RepID=UPI002E7AAD50|nr:hypothetical protein [Microvirga sp. CF3016]MEE1611318.1 hypothetical protein [Microvirga sp. CF3016]
MKKLLVTVSVALLAATSFSGAADARPGKGKGHAYGHYKNHKAQRYYVQRRNNNAAIAAGVTGAILGGALAATARPTYRTYDRSYYRTYDTPRRSYYREEYYDDGY